MLSMVKLWELAEGRRPDERRTSGNGKPSSQRSRAAYDPVVLDAPATGHALAMLRSPQMFSAIARVGPIARQARQVRELLEDPARSAYLAVAQATEMAISETLELRERLSLELGRELHAVVVNGVLPRRFEGHELRRIAELANGPGSQRTKPRTSRRGDGRPSPVAVTRAATRAALAIHERVRSQQGQIARLRRRDVAALTIPLTFQAELDLAAVQRIADRLERKL
jgi:anion-transporting  ArsA/GET3 family ATPase